MLVWGLLKVTDLWSTHSVYLINSVSIHVLGQLSQYTWSIQSVYLINSDSILGQLSQYTGSNQSVYLINSVSILGQLSQYTCTLSHSQLLSSTCLSNPLQELAQRTNFFSSQMNYGTYRQETAQINGTFYIPVLWVLILTLFYGDRLSPSTLSTVSGNRYFPPKLGWKA